MHSVLKKLRDHRADIGLLVFIGVVVSVFFWKVLFLCQPVSRVFLLGKRDVLFRSYFAPGQFSFDESVFLLLVPYYHLVADYWRHFQLPLWNPYCGWGSPFLGDIQAAVFSPFRLLFALSPNMHQFNCLLVLEVACAAMGTYVLARHICLSRPAALFAAVTYGFCPYFLYYLELISGTSSALLPWLFWLFIRMGKQATMPRAVACAVFCSVFIASGHPESSFIDVLMATSCMILVFAFKKELAQGLRWTFTIAPLALCLSAPVIFPFLEYLLNSDCYKFVRKADQPTPVQSILLNLWQPMYWGSSPYLGVASSALAMLACFVEGEKRRYVAVFLAGTITAFICICRPLFFAWIFLVTHLSVLPSTYFIAVFLLELTVLSAFGFDYFAEHLKIGSNKAFYIFCLGLLCTCIVPVVLKLFRFSFASGNFGCCTPDMSFNTQVCIFTVILSLLVFVLLVVKQYCKPPLVWLSVALIAISFGSQTMANKLSMPNTPAFKYDNIDPLPFLAEQRRRIMTLGFDVLCPNTNAVYKIASIGIHNVMQPARYVKFIVAAGARNTTFNTVVNKLPLKRLIDFTGVKYVVSLGSVYGQDDPVPEFQPVDLPHPVEFAGTPELKLTEARLAYDERKAEARGILKFTGDKDFTKRFSFMTVIVDEKGNPFWYGGLSPVLDPTSSDASTTLSGLIPTTFKRNEKFLIGMQIYDSKKGKILTPDLASLPGLKAFGPILALSAHQFCPPDRAAKDLHYRFVSESGPQHVRVYENMKTLGRAYMVFSAEHAASGDQALKLVSEPDFDGFSTVVLEGKTAFSESSTTIKPGISVPIEVDSSHTLEMTVDSPQSGYLVLTDTFYPGWTATVDGKATEILHANYLFRAVQFPAGRHKVVFSYRPLSVTMALLLFGTGVLSALFLCLRKRGKEEAGVS